MTQTPRQMRVREGRDDAPPKRRPSPQPERPVRQRAPRPVRRGVSRSAMFGAMIVVFGAGLFAAPFAQYYLGPRLAELSGLDLAAGGAAPDLARLEALEREAAQIRTQTDALTRDAGGSARVDALENDLALLRSEIEDLTALARRTSALDGNAEQLQALEARLAALESRPAPADASGDIAAIDTRLSAVDTALNDVRAESARLAAAVVSLQDKLEADLKQASALVAERLAILEETRGDATLNATVENLRSRTGALEAAFDRTAGRSALVVSLGNLRAAAERGRPFETELQAVRVLVASLETPQLNGPLDRLAETAGTGLPTLVGLQRGFAAIANRAAQGASAPGEDWVGRTIDRVSSLVTIRRTGDISGTSAEAVVARAEIHMSAGDLAPAVAEMSTLAGQSPEVDAWLQRARQRLDAERALDELASLALALGGSG